MERILVVEDEQIVALDIKMHLQKYGYEVPVTYSSGEEALTHIEHIESVLVLMDIRLQGLDRAAEKSANLTRQLLTFSRRQVLQRKACDLNEIVVDLEKMFRRLLTENVRLYLSCRAKPGTVLVERGQMEQVLMNLVVTARDAMPGGGTLTVRTRNETVSGERVTQTGSVPKGNYAVLSVQDTGCGIQPQDLNRIFEPLFTTKDSGQGTGLGLSTVYGIISQSDGHIQVSSTVGEGASFSIYLPLTEQSVGEDAEQPGACSTPGGNQTLLLVEDDETIRRMLARVLRVRTSRPC